MTVCKSGSYLSLLNSCIILSKREGLKFLALSVIMLLVPVALASASLPAGTLLLLFNVL
jgi:hypothetical protein